MPVLWRLWTHFDVCLSCGFVYEYFIRQSKSFLAKFFTLSANKKEQLFREKKRKLYKWDWIFEKTSFNHILLFYRCIYVNNAVSQFGSGTYDQESV